MKNNQFNKKKYMFKFKFILLCLTLVLYLNGQAQYTDVINSNRPGSSMSAYGLGQSVIQGEMGGYYIKEQHDLLLQNTKGYGTDLVVRYGFLNDKLELITNLQYQIDRFENALDTINRNGIKRFLVGAKYLLYDPYKNYESKVDVRSFKKTSKFRLKDYLPAVSIYAGTNITFPNNPFNQFEEPFLSPTAMVITQNQLPSSLVFVTNIFADKIGSDQMNFGYVLTLTKGFNERWSAFIENKAFVISNYYTDGIITAGAAHLLSQNMQIDLSISKNIKNTPSLLYGGIGVSIRFDDNYKQTLMRDTKVSDAEEKRNKKQRKAEDKISKEQEKNERAADKKKMKTNKDARKAQPKSTKKKKK